MQEISGDFNILAPWTGGSTNFSGTTDWKIIVNSFSKIQHFIWNYWFKACFTFYFNGNSSTHVYCLKANRKIRETPNSIEALTILLKTIKIIMEIFQTAVDFRTRVVFSHLTVKLRKLNLTSKMPTIFEKWLWIGHEQFIRHSQTFIW